MRRVLQVSPEDYHDRPNLILAWRAMKEALCAIDLASKRSETVETLRELEIQLVNWKVLFCLYSLTAKGATPH